MSVTFTNIELNLNIRSTDPNIMQILSTLEDIRSLGSSDLLLIQTQFHVTGENADALIAKFRDLDNMGAVENSKANRIISEIESLKTHYLK